MPAERVKPKRATVFTSATRKPAEQCAERQRQSFPGAHVTVSGEPGLWKVRRELQPHEAREESDDA